MNGIKERWKRMGWMERTLVVPGFFVCLPLLLVFLAMWFVLEAGCAFSKLMGGEL